MSIRPGMDPIESELLDALERITELQSERDKYREAIKDALVEWWNLPEMTRILHEALEDRDDETCSD